MRGIGWRLCILAMLVLVGAPVLATPKSAFDISENGLEILDSQLTVFKDPSARMTIEEVAEADRQGRFQPATSKSLLPGYTREAIWASINLRNDSSIWQRRFIEVTPPRLRNIHLFMPENNRWSRAASGISIPVEERLIQARRPTFSINLAPGEVREIYIRVESGNSIALSIRLWKPDAFYMHTNKIDFINGVQFGAVFLFALYALLLFINARQPVFLFFFGAMTASGFYDVSIQQYGFEFLWPGQTEWSMRSPGVFLALAMSSIALLVSELVQARWYFSRARLFFFFLAAVAALLVPLQLIFPYDRIVPIANILTLILVVFSLFISVLAVWKRLNNALWLLLGFLLLWLTTFWRVAQILGWATPSLWLDYAQSWTVVLGGSVLAVVMIDRVRQLRVGHMKARELMLEERERYAVQLEQEVDARTTELRDAKEAAEDSSRAKSIFLAHMSHELRTPLHSILGYSRLAMNDSVSEINRKRLGAVQRSGHHLLSLIDELLDFARGDTGRQRQELRPTYLHSLLDSAVEGALPLVQAAGARLSTILDPALPPVVLADAVRVHQVLTNLLANACYHSQGGRISLEVRRLPEMTLDKGSVTLWFGVRDNGVGISEEDQKRIFMPFEQVSIAATSHGVGLGLPIAHQLVKLMGGELICESRVSNGSIFSFTITLAVADEAELKPVVGPLGVYRYEGRVRRILIVDGASECRALLADIIASAGFDIALADNGEMALEYLAAQSIDAVVVDQFVSGLDGWQLLQQARARHMTVPFLMLSASPATPPTDWPADLVFDAVLIKPATPDSLLNALGEIQGLAWVVDKSASACVNAGPSQDWVMPPAEALKSLRGALELGQITDIEDWVCQLKRDHPESIEFAELVQDAIRRLDLAFIRRLLEPNTTGL